MKLRQTTIHLVLALFLLLSQQLGMTHAVSHLSTDIASSTAPGKQLPGELHCDQCTAFASIGAALTGSPPSWRADPVIREMAIASPTARRLPSTIRAFDSRAPPVLA
ncbi:hypothetical protein [Noviherbaspirillum massiliense]|uniref:hypothetical protein n=1 Tax=Noviherbaspirillum massiliense TaxID=1465823 RepID=UPI00037B9754|nr:hypothetical protein [Noviherbaspirillum massiliense]